MELLSAAASSAALPLGATTVDQTSYRHFGVRGALIHPRQLPRWSTSSSSSASPRAAAAAAAALKAGSKTRRKRKGGGVSSTSSSRKRGMAGQPGLVCYVPLSCACVICSRLLGPSLGEVQPHVAALDDASALLKELGCRKGDRSRPEQLHKSRPAKAPVAIFDSVSHSVRQSLEDTLFPAEYQVRCLDQHGGSLRRMLVRDVSGVEWGVLALMGGTEKPQRYTDQYHYIFFVLRGRACLTIGDEYNVPLTEIALAEGSTAQVPRGNYYSLKNADATAPATFLFYRTRWPERTTAATAQRGGAARRREADDDGGGKGDGHGGE